MTDWTPLGQVTEIVNALNTAATTADPISAPAHTATQAATSPKTGGRSPARGGADLFGALANAGGEEDMARQAARDEPLTSQATTGARNESSVLFSLSALTSSARSAPTQSLALSSPSASREDSGLIDLKALTAQASDVGSPNASAGVGLVAPSPLGGLAPLGGLGAPLGGAAPAMPGLGVSGLADISYPQKKNRMGLFIGGGIAVGAIALALGFALKPDPPPPPKAEPTPVIVYKTREPEPIKEAEVAKPPPTGEPSAAAAPKAAGPAPKWRPTPKRDKGGSDAKEPGGAAPPTPAAPKSGGGNKCGCASGDLACNMRCAAKGG